MRENAIAIALVSAALVMAPVVSADPAAPQEGMPCPPDMANVMTWPSDAKLPLVCLDNHWQAVTSPQPPNDRWLSFGPTITLHGEGLRNPNLASGNWTAVPQDPNTSCRAEQRAVVEAGVVGSPLVTESPMGQPLTVRVIPQLFSIAMSGYCLWTRTG